MVTQILDQHIITELLDLSEVLDIVETVFRAHGEEQVIMPPKITLNLALAGITSWLNAMPAHIIPLNACGLKWVGGFDANRSAGLPYIIGTIILSDPVRGYTKAIMDGTVITNARTGAQTAVAAKYLASSAARTAAIVGAGTQGIWTARALAQTLPLQEIRFADVDRDRVKNQVDRLSTELGLDLIASPDVPTAVLEADIIVTCTTSVKPYLAKRWVKPGAFISAIGSYQELEEDLTLSADKLFVDSWEQNQHRGELLSLLQAGKLEARDIYGEVGQVVAGKIPGRETPEETIVACIIGMGSHDVAVAHMLWEKARQQGLGFQSLLNQL
ncbi:MAG: ornithine cyclodeaminase family protein [bacterium]|jgi:alanine dehydrogenase